MERKILIRKFSFQCIKGERERERERERIKKKGKPSRAIHEVEITWFLIINFSFFASISLTLADFVLCTTYNIKAQYHIVCM